MSGTNFIVAPQNLMENHYGTISSLDIYRQKNEDNVMKHIENTYVHLTNDGLQEDEKYEKKMMEIAEKVRNMQPNETIVFPDFCKHPECCPLAVRKN